MRILLASLMCLVLFESECFALKGGPIFTGSRVSTIGTYAGLLVPRAVDNSLGIFTATVPQTGVATGTVALFRNGIFYPGTIQAIADPDSGAFTGVCSSSFDITFTSSEDPVSHTTTKTVVTFNANGSVNAKIRGSKNAFTSSAARITGTGAITYKTVGGDPNSDANSDGPVMYQVDGFKQSG